MTNAPKIDTQAPERVWLKPCDPCKAPDDYYVCHPGYLDGRGSEYIRADLSAAREAAAWIAGRDAAAEEAFYACGCKDSIEAIPAPTDPAAALDRLIAERVREARNKAFNEAAGIARAEVERREAAMEKAVICDSILRFSAEADAAERIAILILEAARASKEGQS